MSKSETTFSYHEEGIDDAKIKAHARNGKVYLCMDNPWAGDSETGFGATTSIGLPFAEAERLAKWILENSK